MQKKSPSTHQLLNPSTKLLLAVGLAALTLFAYRKHSYNQTIQPPKQITTNLESPQETQVLIPTKITIGNQVDTQVRQDALVNGKHTISPDSASYLTGSAQIGENGNLIIYGHNYGNIFNNLKKTTEGEIITLTDNQGQTHQYQVTHKNIYAAGNTTPLKPTTEETLTIYTCSGLLDQNRLVIQAKPIDN